MLHALTLHCLQQGILSWNTEHPDHRVVSQFAVAALYERRPAVADRRYKNQTETLPTTASTSPEYS